MKSSVIMAFWMISTVTSAAQLQSGHYLKWDTDHTERQIRPAYAVSKEDIQNYPTYRVLFENGVPKNVCFFAFGHPSNDADFGAHCIQFTYSEDAIVRTYFNIEGERVSEHQGIYSVRYVLNGQQYPSKRLLLDKSNKLIADSTGTAQYEYQRDELGRRTSEIRRDENGQAVPEHNGFYEAHFAFDENDYAVYRRGVDEQGNIMEGKYGYATAHFWFDENGTFVKEEFRNGAGALVLGPSNRYSRIEYKEIDHLGNWHKVMLFDQNEELLRESPAILQAAYFDTSKRKNLRYYDAQMQPAENTQGVHEYRYRYLESGKLDKREAYSLTGELLTF